MGKARLEARPINLRDANEFIRRHHRHHKPVHGQKYSVSAWMNNQLVGVAIIAGGILAVQLSNQH